MILILNYFSNNRFRLNVRKSIVFLIELLIIGIFWLLVALIVDFQGTSESEVVKFTLTVVIVGIIR